MQLNTGAGISKTTSAHDLHEIVVMACLALVAEAGILQRCQIAHAWLASQIVCVLLDQECPALSVFNQHYA